MKCQSAECGEEAEFVVVWPGEPEPLKMCEDCAMKAQRVGQVIGCPIVAMPFVEIAPPTVDEKLS